MEEGKYQHYLSEDINNMPALMKELCLKDIQADPSCCLSLQERCEVCYRQDTGKPVHKEYKHSKIAGSPFQGRKVMGSSPLHLAELGLFWSDRRVLTCFYCGQDIHLVNGEDALEKHADIFRNCRHVCKILEHSNRRPRSGTEMMSCMFDAANEHDSSSNVFKMKRDKQERNL